MYTYIIVLMFRYLLFIICIFFFKQKTAYEMRISDWSSDVCSSDLSKYPEWNPFCIECRSTLQPGDPIDMKVKLMAKPQPQREWVKEYVEGRRFAYAMKPAPLGALSSFRSHDVEAIDGTRKRYRSYFTLQG